MHALHAIRLPNYHLLLRRLAICNQLKAKLQRFNTTQRDTSATYMLPLRKLIIVMQQFQEHKITEKRHWLFPFI